MAIHKEGYKILAIGFIILLIINIASMIIWSDNSLAKVDFPSVFSFALCFHSFLLPSSGQAS